MKRILVLGTVLCLSSCIAPMTRQEVLNIYRKNCLDYGFQWGTPEFAQCVKDQEYQEQKLQIEQRKAQALEDQARALRQDQVIYWEPTDSSSRKKNVNLIK